MFPTPSDQGPLLWRRFIVVRIDRVDMLVRDAETPESFVNDSLAASSSNGTGVCRLAPSGASLHITTGISVIGFLEDRHRHGSIRT